MLLEFGPLEPLARRVALFVSRGLWPRVFGRRNCPRRGGLIVLAAHPGPIDYSLLASAVPRRLQMLGGDFYLRLPFVGSMLKRRGFFALRRVEFGFDEENYRALTAAAEAARNGAAVGLFPQGLGRTFGGGADRLAAMGGTPVLPVYMFLLLTDRATPRSAVCLRRPIAPPAGDARSRRAFRDRLEARLRRAGGLKTDPRRGAILQALLDDPVVWRRPSRLPRLHHRIGRLSDATLRAATPPARALRRAARRLRCSIGDLRNPGGAGIWFLYAALWGPAAVGLVLAAPALLAVKAMARRANGAHEKQMVRLFMGVPVGLVWGLLLLPLRWWAPFAALLGLLAFGACKPVRRRATAAFRARRVRARLRPIFERLEAALAGSPEPSRGPARSLR